MGTGATRGAAADGIVRFVLDGEVIELDNPPPTRTVLQFLREDLRRTGTKEGCAEGDCGACTVVLAEVDHSGSDLRLSAINSCIQFLPTLDGKELITVESLAADTRDLHPVQRALVDEHGSQCGFCTPGFVMSLFALYKSESAPGRVDIDDALAGNLCRCTGYRPIIAAAQSMYRYAGDDWLRQPAGVSPAPRERVQQLDALKRTETLTIDVDGQRFFAPRSAAALAAVLAENPDATILAGGTDVGLWVTKQHADLDTVVYLGEVAELKNIDTGGSHIEIGAGVTFTDAMPVLIDAFPDLEELLRRFASPPIRNAATIGGNVANGSPIGDSMPALMALDATLVLQSADGRRELPLDAFYRDYMVNERQPGEFVAALRIPKPASNDVLRAWKISKRFDQDISAVCAALRLRLDGETIVDARVAFGGMAATVARAPACEQTLQDAALAPATIAAAKAALAEDFAPISDMRAAADYRLRVAQNLLERLYLDLSGAQTQTVYGYGR